MAKPFVATPNDGVAWVTGASSGIGAAVAARLAAQGFTVAVTARRQEELEDLAESVSGPGRIVPMAGDVTDAEAMDGLVGRIEAELGALALVVLNAGVYIPVSGDELDRDAFAKTFDVNLKGTVNALVPAANAMKSRGKGQIAIVASVAGYSGLPTSAAYGASKAGLLNLAEALKFDFDHLGLTIQVISPGFVDTPATADNPFPMPFLMEVDDAADRLIAGLATGRFEVTFPRRFTYQLKLLRALPYWLFFPLLARATGWNKDKATG
ncbi:SDR family NAD(P)-dependent oxidoreductase [Amorphus orientalis]|uniref:NAD(P)-dependent dehydrogenase (Short-subunit alcohol dehydrogenase family) n=1 Tax=Amorphus orientalis TaxID=649198 RepID=A0AAE4ASJ3_9HYPH|nr:SDR family NAD(P)-dependent oxidoreductase [Amorphus orientalis]MDQ0316331.1 NAD(P)-dependent dehydrogenase (short-subunit alcohol dehydrogenase family) [Amorphus orientalis]